MDEEQARQIPYKATGTIVGVLAKKQDKSPAHPPKNGSYGQDEDWRKRRYTKREQPKEHGKDKVSKKDGTK